MRNPRCRLGMVKLSLSSLRNRRVFLSCPRNRLPGLGIVEVIYIKLEESLMRTCNRRVFFIESKKLSLRTRNCRVFSIESEDSSTET
ncbi:hypothetical protein AT1G34042 [Arabidopsis thaliana]|uniref:Uncharacterized protein n=1 Tax=Arabidopsis thaliana TaxID=3702 RepID=B3H662_ARATH|nr:uncharacterized protein AT1G34042 [Arabidopsis thaliana]AEE31662.1 hypothetical protein AT1G34042 [Arabidopsis thaliana]|eukprot:NP_001117408.1 hypothetical protein AT1G34042 [Arabidopsis thaliana]